ncbi:hypothetical protein [Nocardioides zhouii]|uniref:Uncharacterized protein n=1 Tax=Nocardioides zhouii TaxID=1168729 RepID=A0A4Q2SNI5_9ACTN|nr:hypothetical protein [Nocardioides zhouii]RYC05639.1 hypothetical protein EUA94_17990 [Nocardioides zhouii]
MWNIEGHDIELAGGPYESDWGAPQVMVHCTRCPDGSDRGWNLWSDPDELGLAIEPAIGIAVVAQHLRETGVDVPDGAEEGATFMGVLQNEVEAGLDVLRDYFETTVHARHG